MEDVTKLRKLETWYRNLALAAAFAAGTTAVYAKNMPAEEARAPRYVTAGTVYANTDKEKLYGLAAMGGLLSLQLWRRRRDAEARLEQAEREVFEACELA
jgi:hypothetical protein